MHTYLAHNALMNTAALMQIASTHNIPVGYAPGGGVCGLLSVCVGGVGGGGHIDFSDPFVPDSDLPRNSSKTTRSCSSYMLMTTLSGRWALNQPDSHREIPMAPESHSRLGRGESSAEVPATHPIPPHFSSTPAANAQIAQRSRTRTSASSPSPNVSGAGDGGSNAKVPQPHFAASHLPKHPKGKRKSILARVWASTARKLVVCGGTE